MVTDRSALNTSKSGCTLALGSPFDYRSSTLLYLVTDINQPGYQQALDQGLIALFRASEGRGLALLTSYSGLRGRCCATASKCSSRAAAPRAAP